MLIEASTPLYQDRFEEDLSRELLVIAANVGADAPYSTDHVTAPGNPGAVSFKEDSPAISVIGDFMPSVETAREELEQLHESELLGNFMHEARISRLTGCIMRPGFYRNHKGYGHTSIKAVRELGLGNSTREAHRVVHFARQAETTGNLPTAEELGQEVDHYCRNPACLYHTRLLAPEENNALRCDAREIEPDIVHGRQLYIGDLLQDMPWLTYSISEEGYTPAKVISTRVGPFALRTANEKELVVYGERIPCEIYDSLKDPGKKPANRKSRAKPKIPKPIPNHLDLFPKTKFRKKHLEDITEKYSAAKKLAA